MLTRLLDAAAHLDRVAGPPVLEPLARLDSAVGRRLLAGARTAERRIDLAAEVVAVLLQALAVLAARAVRAGVTEVALPLLVAAHRVAQDHALPPSARVVAAPAAQAATARRSRSFGTRELAAASLAVFLVGVAAATTGGTPAGPALRVVPTAAERPEREPLRLDDGVDSVSARPEARVVPREPAAPPAPGALPTFVPPPAPAPAPVATRWLPNGAGMWLHDWARSEGGSARAVVDRAQASGFTHLYVQTGSSKKGWIGDEVLSQLLPATASSDLKVIAWDFPKLIDPEADARRMAAAATWQRPGVPRVAAVAPDVETAAEGTHLTPHAVLRYYRELRRSLPPEVAVLATVPWPSEKRTSFYPYAETAAHSDAFVPMAYWYNRAPVVVTETSMRWLAQFGLPVMPVGQGYDGRIDAPYLPEDPDPAASVQAFVDAAWRGGAASISLWSWQTTGQAQWDALARAATAQWPVAVGVPVPQPQPPPPAPLAPPAPLTPPAAQRLPGS